MKSLPQIILLFLISVFLPGCGEDGFPVPPASTVPLFSFVIDNDGFAPATVTFTNESIVPEPAGTPTYYWNFGDGASSNEVDPVHDYASPGVYSVKLVVTMSVSLEIKELTKSITIKSLHVSGTPVFFTDGSNVYSGFLNEDPPIFYTLPIGPFEDSYGLALDTVENLLYISDFDANSIYRCDMDGKNLTVFRSDLLGPDGLAIDYTGRQLYWDTDNGVQRADMTSEDVNQVEDFVTGQANDPEGVSVDQVNHKLYWVNYNGGLWSKNLDGTGEAEIIPLVEGGSTLVVGNRLVFDQWVATGDIHLKSSNLDGSGISLITTGITKVVFGIGYEKEGNKIYWGDRGPGKIMRSNPDGSNIETWYESAGSNPRGIVFGKKQDGK